MVNENVLVRIITVINMLQTVLESITKIVNLTIGGHR